MNRPALVDHQVLQRTFADGVKLTVDVGPDVAALRVLAATGARDHLDVVQASSAGEAQLELGVGGPYTVQVQQRDGRLRTLAHDVLVGDLWVLAGQSNMQGCGELADAEEPSPLVHLFGLERRWEVAAEPLIVSETSPDFAHCEVDGAQRRELAAAADFARRLGAGLGLRFGKEMAARNGVPVGLVAAARGGTSLTQWSPRFRDAGGASLYGSMLRSIAAVGGCVAGVLWYQGESDAVELSHETYRERFSELIRAVREDLADAALPFFHVQLARIVYDANLLDAWTTVQNAQLDVARTHASGMAAAIDLPLEDWIHVRADGLQRLGRRLARLASGSVPSPDVRRVEVEGAAATRVRVHFDGVTGGLVVPGGRVAGFSIRTADGTEAPVIVEATVCDRDRSSVVLQLSRPPLPGEALWYGYGLDPFCNVVDADDMAMPKFGPVPLVDAAGEPISANGGRA